MNKNYLKKMIDDPLPPLPEDERIYFNVPYTSKDVAKYCHCRFCPERKLWFTGYLNANLPILVELYGINEKATSDKAMKLLKEKLKECVREKEKVQ